MNPMAMLKLKTYLEHFKQNHPKVISFFSAASCLVDKDSVIELKVTSPEGKTIVTNMKVSEDDIALIAELKKLTSAQ